MIENTTTEIVVKENKVSTQPPFLKELSRNSAEMNKLRAELEATMVQQLTEYERGLAYGWFLTEMKKQITKNALDIIKSLMNTGIGFKTDKNPHDPIKPSEPYNDEIVKNCVIQAMMHKLRIYGNEFNILGGNFYATKEGLSRIVHEHPDLEKDIDYKNKGFTQSSDTKNWKFIYSYSFKKKGEKEVNGECTFFIKGMTGKNNSYEVAFDAIQGKAERKVLKTIYNKLNADQGFRLEDADDVDEIIETEVLENSQSKLSALNKNLEQK